MYLDYLQIPYKHRGRDTAGVDCFGLVKLFYAREFNIHLPDHEYTFIWYRTAPDLIVNAYSLFGFTETREFKYGNVLILSERGYLKHLGIVLPDCEYFLHTTTKGTCVSQLNQGQWCNKTGYILRHEGLK